MELSVCSEVFQFCSSIRGETEKQTEEPAEALE